MGFAQQKQQVQSRTGIQSVHWENLKCTAMSMDFFDCLIQKGKGIQPSSGPILLFPVGLLLQVCIAHRRSQTFSSLSSFSAARAFIVSPKLRRCPTRADRVHGLSDAQRTPTRNPGIVGDSGNIRGCYSDVFDGVTVSDKLRELLVNPESENADVFSADQTRQLLFHVFKTLCVGGGVCQPDDRLEAYTQATKALYKVIYVPRWFLTPMT